jgi:hypothetical protein
MNDIADDADIFFLLCTNCSELLEPASCNLPDQPLADLENKQSMAWWTLIGVETEMPWPTEDYTVEFKGQQLLLRPPTERRMPMICIESSDRPMNNDALAVLAREFMSELVWMFPYPLIEVTRSGASFLMDLGPAPLRHCKGIGFYIDYLPQLQDAKSKLSLAFYREAKSVNSRPYSFLGYWKVVSLLHKDGSSDQRQWLIQSLSRITNFDAKKRLAELRALGESDDDIVKQRLYVSRRCAVAHATSQPVINPDDPSQEYEIWKDLPLIKAIAEHAIEFEFGVKSRQTVYREHLYELDGFKKIFGNDALVGLKEEMTPRPSTLAPLPNLDIKIATKTQTQAFSNLTAEIFQVDHGKVLARCCTPDGLVAVRLLLDFPNERFEFQPAGNTVIADNGTPTAIQHAIDHLHFCCDLFSNGRVEVFEHSSKKLLGKKDPFVGVNINLGATLRDWEAQIELLKVELGRRNARIKPAQEDAEASVFRRPEIEPET